MAAFATFDAALHKSVRNLTLTLLVVAVILNLTAGLPQSDNSIDFSEDRNAEADRFQAVIEQLCENRPGNEYFRLSTESNCR